MINRVCVIYAGGTFGCALGADALAPLSPDDLLPLLSHALDERLSAHAPQILFRHSVIKDSSTFSADDFVAIANQVVSGLQECLRVVVITGSDTLAHLAAFLHFSIKGRVVVTGSMQPFARVVDDGYAINYDGDALDNLKLALNQVMFGELGVFVAFNGIFQAPTCQKIHSTDVAAFAGKSQPILINPAQKTTIAFSNEPIVPKSVNIQTLYALPNLADDNARALNALLDTEPFAVILQGFGAGNLPKSHAFESALSRAKQNGVWLILTTQCPFGGVHADYAAGVWLHEHTLNAGALPMPCIYALLLFLALTCADVSSFKRHVAWLDNA